MAQIKAFAGISRAPFLVLPVTLVAVGAAAAAYEGNFSWSRTLGALVALVLLHVAVNALNEASDMRTGIDLKTQRTPFSGGSGTLPSGVLTYRTAYLFGLITAVFGAAIGIWLMLLTGWQLLPIVILGAVAVMGYSDALARFGLGEFFAGLGLGSLPVIGTALVQPGGAAGSAVVAASLPAFFMTFNLLLLNEFPDESPDRAGGRRNLVLLLGRRAAAIVYAIAAIAVPASIIIAVVLGALPKIALIGVIPSLLLFGPLRWVFSDTARPVPIPAMGQNVIWNLATNSFLAVALAIAAYRS